MPVSIEELRPHLQAFDFPRLFVEGLGWDHFQGESLAIPVDGFEYALRPVAKKAEFAVFQCAPGSDGAIPDYPLRRKIETQVTKRAFEHLIIFVDAARTQQVWQWVKRQAGKPTACREHRFYAGQTGQPLLQRLDNFLFTLEDEAKGIGITDVVSLVGKVFDVEKVTKRFYERFRAELTAFGNFIEGITAQGDRDWYASLMLNRMMFVYFIQKKNFLDGDPDYLRNRLSTVRNQSGGGRFQQFYRIFLLRLFHKGLALPEAQRTPDLIALLGKVPFLNGGLFDQHALEQDNPDISIPDAAFERVFDFFDGYTWHLDDRPGKKDNEINPDVLGYIFEKYVNQKQMGAYYTKEDITGYISRNTVIPFLFDAARKECPVAFGPDGGVWRLLRDDPDRYIYPAVGHGITWNARQAEDPKPLDTPFHLPDDIAAGIGDVSQRGGWNRPAPDDYALPTETWREVVARRTRYEEVRAKLASGEAQNVNDLITLNLDIERFARDVIAQSAGHDLLRAFWHAMRDVSVLDPTCGSGAFLFAALNILEPLYTACLEGMRGFLDDAERSEHKRSASFLEDFRKVLDEADGHPSERYFILKSIVLNNLYGVDIMEEAVEICKLRLFLKLVAQLETYDQIEPLPDIDFNIRAGNTLVGFTSLDAVRQAMTVMPNGQYRALDEEQQRTLARIEEDADVAGRAFDRFREQQTALGGEVTAEHKKDLRDRLQSLGNELDRLLAAEYGVDPKKTATYDAWRNGHQPFHWFAEFYGIMARGGFDVVIGNPPYVEYSKIRREYEIRGFETEQCGNLYALCAERSSNLLGSGRRLGFIVQAPVVSTQRMSQLRELLYQHSEFTSYAIFNDRPSKLFQGMNNCRVCIVLHCKGTSKQHRTTATTRYHKWYKEETPSLLDLVQYQFAPVAIPGEVIPKLRSQTDLNIYRKVLSLPTTLGSLISATPTEHRIYYKITGVNRWFTFTTSPPRFWRDGIEGSSTRESSVCFPNPLIRDTVFCLLWSTFHYWLYQARTNCRDFNPSDLESIPIPDSIADGVSLLQKSAHQIISCLEENSDIQAATYNIGGAVEYQRFSPASAKPFIDNVDRMLAEHYGFTDEELDFIINYDIKYRMGREG